MLLQTSSVGYQPEKPDLEAYSQLCCVDEVKTILDGVVNKSSNGEAWLRKTNIVHVNIENQQNEILYTRGKAKEFFSAVDCSKSQMEDKTIAKLI